MLLIATTIFATAGAQTQKELGRLMRERGEYYFTLTVEKPTQIQAISEICSVDGTDGKTVVAYANQKEYDRLLKAGYKPELQTPPCMQEETVMWDGSDRATYAWDSYPTYDAYQSMMEAFPSQAEQTGNRSCTLLNLGTLNSGRKILGVRLNNGNPDGKPRFLYSSTMHGDEVTGMMLMLRLIDEFCTSNDSRIVNLLNNLLTVSADLFYIDWRRMQITSTIAGVGNITTNAGHTDSKGAELNIVARPVKGLQFTANYGYTYARFLSYEKSKTVSYTNNRLPLVPNHTLSLDANYTINPTGWLDRVMFNVGLRGLGRIYWAEDNLVSQDFYTLLNAKVALTKGIVTWEVWGKNLTNTDYMAYGFKSSSGNYAQAGRPLMFGTTIELNF